MSKKSTPSVQDVDLQGGRMHKEPHGPQVTLPAGEFTITSEHEDPKGMEGLPGDVGTTSKEADIGFAGGNKGQRTGPMGTGSEVRRHQDPTA